MLQAGLTRRELIKSGSALLPAAAFMNPLSAEPLLPALNFIVVGDWGRRGKHHQRPVAEQMARNSRASDAKFIVSTGDNFYNFGVTSVNDPHWRQSFEEVYADPALQLPWYPVLGNHDYGGDVHAQVQRSRVSERWQMPDRWYRVDGARFGRPDVHLFLIDTVAWKGREAFPFKWLGSDISREYQSAQRAWLESELTQSTAPIKLVFGHHPIYSIGPHGGRMDLPELDALLKRTRTTAYVNGHDHCLYHISHQGLHYVCSGGGSKALPRYTGDRAISGCVLRGHCNGPPSFTGPNPVWQYYWPQEGFAALAIGADRVGLRFIDWAGVARYETVLRVAS